MKKVILFLLVLVLIGGCLFSWQEFGTPNGIGTALGLFRVCVLDAPYARTGLLTRTYIGQSESGFAIFLSAMEDMGYSHLPEEQMGSLHFFKDRSGNLIHVLYQVNAYYSKWIWC